MSRRPRSKVSPARLAALKVVRMVRERDAYAQDLITKYIDTADLLLEDRAFATRLVLGVVSSKGTLDEVINRALRSPSDIKPNVRDALRISTYEIIFLDKSPHAAVDQGVELVRSCAPKAAGLANAVLRNVVNLKSDFPFGDPTRDLDALARMYAFPGWLTQKLIEDLGTQAAVEFMRASNEPAPLFVAVNAVKTRDQAVLDVFSHAHEALRQPCVGDTTIPGCYQVSDSRALLVPEIKQLISQGKILVSDAASQLVASSVLPDVWPTSCLEIGAGRATKTILLQSNALRKYGDQIYTYVTLDNQEFKTNILRDRSRIYGIQVDEALSGNALKLDDVVGDRRFALVFIDAPCSGLGTLRRHPEIRWRIKPEDFKAFSHVQLGMLESAASHVEPGGLLAYSTCTVSAEENRGVVKEFLDSDEGANFSLESIAGHSCLSTRLSRGSSDAHFALRMKRQV